MARIVFDLDGTLVDSNPTLTATGNALLAELGRPAVSPDLVASFIGHGIAVLVERLLAHTGGVPVGGPGPAIARFRALYDADPLTGTTVFPGAAAALASLAAAGHGLGVCTQKLVAPSRAILEALGLMPPITGLTGGDSLPVMKPDPGMVAHVAAQLPPGPIVYVGDSEVDAATAAAAEVPFLLHTGGYLNAPTAGLPLAGSFADYAELPALVARLLAPAAPA